MVNKYIMPDGKIRWFSEATAPKGAQLVIESTAKEIPAEVPREKAEEPENKAAKPANKAKKGSKK